MTPKVLCDTRQQAGKHRNVDEWFEAHGVPYEYRKLDFGDYMVEGSNISIDTKRNLAEVAGNVGRDHARFARELDRAREAGYQLVILVEAGLPYRKVEDVAKWTAKPCQRCARRMNGACRPRASMRCARFRTKPMQGPQVARIMQGLAEDHGCLWEFCDRRATARRICEILGVRFE